MPELSADSWSPSLIVYVRPSDPRRTAIAAYGESFRAVLGEIAGVESVDLLPADLTETIDSRAARRAVEDFVDRALRDLPRAGDRDNPPIVHAEMGNACHREFWAAHRLQEHLPHARFYCTVHDPPTLCSNPYRYIDAEFEGKSPLRLLNTALTKAAETLVDRMKRRVEKRFVRRCEGLIALSKGGVEAMRRHSLFRGARLHRLDLVCPLESLDPAYRARMTPASSNGAGEFVTTFFGFISPGKGIRTLIDAFGILVERVENEGGVVRPRLLNYGGVAGNPKAEAYVSTLRRRIERSPHAERIAFAPGFVDDAERDRRLARSHVLVLPFRTAPGVVSASGSVIQAMSLGKAIVATRSNTLEEEISDGVTGLLCPEGDAGALADRLCALARDPALRQRLGQNARRHIQTEHAPSAIAATLESIYRTEAK